MSESTGSTIAICLFLVLIFGAIGWEKYANSAAENCANLGTMEYKGEKYICTKVSK